MMSLIAFDTTSAALDAIAKTVGTQCKQANTFNRQI